MAVGTAATSLTTLWVSLGTAPMILQVQSGNAKIAVAGSAPAADAAGLSLPSGSAPISITGSGQVWARAVNGSARIVAAILA